MTHDAELCARVRAGDGGAVRELVEREYAVAEFYARVVAEFLPSAQDVLWPVWESVVSDVRSGELRDDLRVAVLSRVHAALRPELATDEAVRVPPQGTFAASGDRWEGWWETEPTPWRAGTAPDPGHVLGALRRLPPVARAVLVLRDVAGLSMADVGTVIPGVRHLEVLLEAARDAYLVEVDRELVQP